MGLEAGGKKMATSAKYGAGKGFMKGPFITKKPPVLLREDLKYSLE